MKLRIKGSSLRLRLTQGEIRALAETGQVEEKVPFAGGAALLYRLRRDPQSSAISATYSGNLMEIVIPQKQAQEWCETDQVTVSETQAVSGGESLRITLEKDFACLTVREGEDESDNFPHPATPTGTPRC